MNKDIKVFLEVLAKAVKKARKAIHINQLKLAEMSNLELSSIKRAENPRIADDLKLSTFIFVVRTLNLDANSIVYPERIDNSPTKEAMLNLLATKCSEDDCKFIESAFRDLVNMAHSRNTAEIKE